MAPAAADELRLAFKAFRAAGKPILAHSQGLYAAGHGHLDLRAGRGRRRSLDAAGASFQVTGLAARGHLLQALLRQVRRQRRLPAALRVQERGQSATSTTTTPPPHRESELSWMGSVYDTALAAAAADRKPDPRRPCSAALEAGPYSRRGRQGQGPDRPGRPGQRGRGRRAASRPATAPSCIDFADYAARATRPTPAASGPRDRGDRGRGRHHHRHGRQRQPVRRPADDLFRRRRQGLLRRHRRQGRQGHRVPRLLARRLGHRLGADPARPCAPPRRPASRWWFSMGDLRGLGRLLDLVAGLARSSPSPPPSPARSACSAASSRWARRWRGSASTCAA